MKIERSCAHCGASFMVLASRVRHGRGLNCSPACQYAAKRAQPKQAIQCSCIGCGSAFTRSPSQFANKKGAGKYCSRPCRDRHWKGEKNPNWQNADRHYTRGPHWQAIKRRIRERDGCCQRCGSAESLHVHHLIPFRMFACDDAANADSNLITLCASCHRSTEAIHKWANVGGGSILQFSANGPAWQLARERGLV